MIIQSSSIGYVWISALASSIKLVFFFYWSIRKLEIMDFLKEVHAKIFYLVEFS